MDRADRFEGADAGCRVLLIEDASSDDDDVLLIWSITCVDRQTGVLTRQPYRLDTGTLDSVIKGAVEICIELGSTHLDRRILNFRKYFRLGTLSDLVDWKSQFGQFHVFSTPNYYEDQFGNELFGNDLARAMTGNEQDVLLPSGMAPHDLEYLAADKPAINVAHLTLNQEQIQLLDIFARDLQELRGCAFVQKGPG
jgi:hypothetical protein